MRYTQLGKVVVSFSVAASNGKDTTWFEVSVWGDSAENHKRFLRKGSPVLVKGYLRADKDTGGPYVYEKKDGSCGAKFEVNALVVRYLPDGKNDVSDDGVPF